MDYVWTRPDLPLGPDCRIRLKPLSVKLSEVGISNLSPSEKVARNDSPVGS